jgi:hypothetical protein
MRFDGCRLWIGGVRWGSATHIRDFGAFAVFRLCEEEGGTEGAEIFGLRRCAGFVSDSRG